MDHTPGGLLYIDKPQGVTSHDVVAVVRRAARTRRVGHAGTLDPFATGVLVVAVGACTRLLQYVVGEPKVYDAVIAFGSETNTDDSTGVATVSAGLPDWSRLDFALASLTGQISQVPPAFSAKHVQGKRAYELARRGEVVTLPPVPVTVHSWNIVQRTSDTLAVRITCGSGTYIRSLARDLGRALDSAAHCRELRRVASGFAHVDAAVAYAQLVPGSIVEGTISLINPLYALGDIAHEKLDESARANLNNGRLIPVSQRGKQRAAFLDSDEQVLGIGELIVADEGREWWQPRVVLPATGQVSGT